MLMSVTHIVASDTDAVQLETIAAHCNGASAYPQRTLFLGGGRPVTPLPSLKRVSAWLTCAPLAAFALRRALRDDHGGVLHIWSASAAPACLSYLRSALRRGESWLLLVDATALPTPGLRRWMHESVFDLPEVRVVCGSTRQRDEFLALGWAECRLMLQPHLVDGAAPQGDVESARKRLGLTMADYVVAIAPPITHYAGAFTAAWAALLAHEVSPRVRLLIPSGPDTERIARLAETSRRAAMCRFVNCGSMAEMLALADACIYLGDRAQRPDAVHAALCAKRPTILAKEIGEREALNGADIHECEPTPRVVARAILALSERNSVAEAAPTPTA